MNTFKPTSKYVKEPYLTAAKWIRSIQHLDKVVSVDVYDDLTAVLLGDGQLLGSDDLSKLVQHCTSTGRSYSVLARYGSIQVTIQ